MLHVQIFVAYQLLLSYYLFLLHQIFKNIGGGRGFQTATHVILGKNRHLSTNLLTPITVPDKFVISGYRDPRRSHWRAVRQFKFAIPAKTKLF